MLGFRKKHKWASLITPQLCDHFDETGYDLVRHDVSNHNYRDQNKQRAAIAWLYEERTKTEELVHWILVVAILTLLATVVAAWAAIQAIPASPLPT